MKKMLLVDSEVLPEIFLKVIEAKKLLLFGKAKRVTDATKKAGISRSTYYKYKDYVYEVSDAMVGKKATFELLLEHFPGVLSSILDNLAYYNCNIITINQTVPINDCANVVFTVDLSKMEIDVEDLISILSKKKGVLEVSLLAME